MGFYISPILKPSTYVYSICKNAIQHTTPWTMLCGSTLGNTLYTIWSGQIDVSLWPSAQQWQRWSLPSKLTAIGTIVSIISLGLYGLEKAFQLSDNGRFFPPAR